MFSRLFQWLLFTVFFGLLPFWAAALNIISKEKSISLYSFPFDQLWPRGELMLVTSVLAADLAGDLIYHTPSDGITQLAAGIFFLLFAINVIWYMMVQSHEDYIASTISNGSILLFGLVIIGGILVKLWLNRRVYGS
jgi:hypothetical protein